VLDDLAPLVRRILDGGPLSRLLATSRQPLVLDGERIVLLGPMALPAGPQEDSDAVQLFVSRARDEAPGFDPAANREQIVEICKRLDGIPLALELAAARLRSLSPTEVVERLDDRFRLLTRGRRTATERHRTLRATIEWSYQLLDEAQQDCFERLAVFAGAFTIADAAAVVNPTADEWQMLDLLSELVERSLVFRAADHRYRLLETIRAFSEECAAMHGTLGEARRAHARWFRAKASAALESVWGPNEVAVAHALLEQLPDFDVAMAAVLDDGDASAAIDIVQNLYHSLMMVEMGLMSGMSSIDRLLAGLQWDKPNLGWPAPLSDATVVRALEFGTGWTFAMRGDRDKAGKLAAATIRTDPSNSFAHAFASRIALIIGDVDGAVEHGEVAMRHATDPIRRLLAVLYVAHALAEAGRVDDALQIARKLSELTERADSRVGAVWAHLLMGRIHRRVDPEVALRYLAVGASLADEIGLPVALHFIQRERLALSLNDPTRDARGLLIDVLSRARRTGDRGNLPMFLADAVTMLHRLGDAHTATSISRHVEVTALDPAEVQQLDDTITELRTTLGSEFETLTRESGRKSIDDLLAHAIDALQQVSNGPSS